LLLFPFQNVPHFYDSYFFAISYFFSLPLRADVNSVNTYDPSHAILGSEPSAFVKGVNVISGTYSSSQVDMVVPGALPIVIQRSYMGAIPHKEAGIPEMRTTFLEEPSTDPEKRFNVFEPQNQCEISYNWEINHSSRIVQIRNQKKEHFVYMKEGGWISSKYTKDANGYALSDEALAMGLTNANGEISGQTNPKNARVEKKKGCAFSHIDGAKNRQYFAWLVLEENGKVPNEATYLLSDEILPNGQRFHMDLNKDNRVKTITSFGVDNSPFAKAKLSHGKRRQSTKIAGSSPYTVNYHYHKREGARLLASVLRPNGPDENYYYDEKNRLANLRRPDGRGLDLSYYQKGNNRLFFGNVAVGDKDPLRGRIKQIVEPAGVNGEYIPTATFEYFPKVLCTKVYNALNHPTSYYYNNWRQLNQIVHTLDKTPYYTLNMQWGIQENKGNLISRYAKDGQGNGIYCEKFTYDAYGNPIEERFYGNLSGENTIPLVIDNQGVPQDNGSEYLQVARTYSSDGMNLLLSEKTDQVETRYQYQPDTNVMTAKYLLVDGKIRERNFYHYDSKGILIREITDDGSHPDERVLKEATERYIKETIPHLATPVGLPHHVIEKAYDFSAGVERLIKRTEYLYDLAGNITTENHFNRDNAYIGSYIREYDAKGHCISELDPLARKIIRTYDANGNLVIEQGPRQDYHKQFGFDYCNRLVCTSTFLSTGEKLDESIRYDELGRKVATVDSYGNETNYFYDTLNRLIEIQSPPVQDENGQFYRPSEKRDYDELGHCTQLTDAQGNITKTTYNVRGQPLSKTHPNGATEAWTYTLKGWLKKHTDTFGLTTLYTNDYKGRVIKTEVYSSSNKLLKTTSSIYNHNHLLSETDASGITTHYTYDCFGYLTSTHTEDKCTLLSYDACGRVKEKHEGPRIACCHYDALNNIICKEVKDSTGNIYSRIYYAYDADGNCILEKEEQADQYATKLTEYNHQGKPLKVTDAAGNETHFIYHTQHLNEYGQRIPRTETIDALGRRKVVEYDTLTRPVRTLEMNAAGAYLHAETILYDKASNPQHIKQTIFAPGQAEREVLNTQLFDANGHVIVKIEAAGKPEEKRTLYSYDLSGNLLEVTKNNGIHLYYTYDDLGRTSSLSSSDSSVHYQYHYDLNDHLIKVEDLVHNEITSREYDTHGRLIKESAAHGLESTYQYDSLDRFTCIHLPDQSNIVYNYNPCHLTRIDRKDYNCTYQHALSGQLTTVTLPKGIASIHYTTDVLHRPVSINSPVHNENLTYDALSNVLSHQIQAKTTQYNYDELNQLTAENGDFSHNFVLDSLHNRLEVDQHKQAFNDLHQVLQKEEVTCGYDLNGNLIRLGNTLSLTYDTLDRLIEVKNGDQITRYHYDSFHRRLRKSTLDNDQYFIYIGDNEIGSCNTNKHITELRILGLGKGAEIGAAIAYEINDALYIPIHDAFGNVIHVLDSQGNSVERTTYSAFQEESSEGSLTTPWRFSTKRLAPETGFLYFGQRYFVPQLGCWLTPDPLGFIDGPNPYAYLHHSPLAYCDLYGLWTFAGCWDSFCSGVSSAYESTKYYTKESAIGTYEGAKNLVFGSNLPEENISETRANFRYVGQGGVIAAATYPPIRYGVSIVRNVCWGYNLLTSRTSSSSAVPTNNVRTVAAPAKKSVTEKF
jgi:RHS repeat-associated protein